MTIDCVLLCGNKLLLFSLIQKDESTVVITIEDVNDHAPEFTKSNYEFHVMENVTIRQIVGRVTALDKDDGINGKLTYSLSGKGSQYFGVKSVMIEIINNISFSLNI